MMPWPIAFVPPGSWPNFGVLLTCVFLTSAAQLCLKSGSANRSNILASVLHPRTLFGYGLLALVTVSMVFASQRLPLKLVVAFQAPIYVLVMIGACAFLGERPTTRGILGALLIVLGVVVFNL